MEVAPIKEVTNSKNSPGDSSMVMSANFKKDQVSSVPMSNRSNGGKQFIHKAQPKKANNRY